VRAAVTAREPSWGALLLVLAAAALVAASFLLPWWTYDFSSGRKTPDGGPQAPSDTRVERHHEEFGPYAQSGDAPPSDAGAAKTGTLWMGAGATAAGAALLVALVGEVARFLVAFPRWLSLASLLTCAVGCIAALAATVGFVPGSMSGHGVQGTFTDRLLDAGYVRTTLDLGWVAALVAALCSLGAFGFRYQAGAHEAAAVEAYA
jgi:hypothetical protein